MLQELKTQHREVARLAFEGRKPVEIATMTGMNIGTVRGILKDPMCKAAIQRLNDTADDAVVDVRRRLAEMNGTALDTLEECMTQEISQSVKLHAAKDVLDRNGYAPRTAIDHTHLHITPEELAGIKERALQAKDIPLIREEPIADAEYEEL